MVCDENNLNRADGKRWKESEERYLFEKCNEGKLTAKERAEYEAYVQASEQEWWREREARVDAGEARTADDCHRDHAQLLALESAHGSIRCEARLCLVERYYPSEWLPRSLPGTSGRRGCCAMRGK